MFPGPEFQVAESTRRENEGMHGTGQWRVGTLSGAAGLGRHPSETRSERSQIVGGANTGKSIPGRRIRRLTDLEVGGQGGCEETRQKREFGFC